MMWLVGPQLLGLIFMLTGAIQKYFPPKKVNSFYGYRTPSSMKNQKMWDEANRYSGILMIKAGLICIAVGFLLAFGLHHINMETKTRALCICMSFIATSMITIILLLMRTEKHLGNFERYNP